MDKSLQENNFSDIWFQDGEKPVICYRFGTTVYEEEFDCGRLVAAGWNTAGYTQNVLEGMPLRLPYEKFAQPQSFDLEADGRSLSWDWKFAGFAKQTEPEEFSGRELLHGIVTLKSKVLPLTVRVHTVLDGTSVMTRYFTVENNGDRPVNLNTVAPMCGGMEFLGDWDEYLTEPAAEKLYSLGYFEASSWGQEGEFRWHSLPNAGYSVYGRYRRERYRHPAFFLKNNALGTLFFAQLAWTGGYEMRFDLNADDAVPGIGNRSDRKARLTFRLALDSQKPLLVLDPGETFVSPAVHIGCIQGELDDAVNAMHRHIRQSVFTFPDARGGKAWVEAGVGPERIMDFRAVRHIAETAAAVGAEIVTIDAGWNCPAGTEVAEWWQRTGDWEADPEKYPDGFREIREYLHGKGLLFGLWMDAERIGPASALYRQHPDWQAKRYVSSQGSTMLDMTKPEVVEWVECQIGRLAEEYGMDLFRLDFNTDSGETFLKLRRGDTDECGALRYYQAVTAMYARLRKKYPGVIFENCAGGGGRTDLAFVRNFTHTWVSDWQIAPRSFAITNGMTMVLPPECVDRLVSGMYGHTRASLDFQVRETLFGRPTTNTYNAAGSESNPGQIEFVRHSYKIYKEFIRPYLTDGRIYHHTPECWGTQPKGTGILERASSDGTRGVIGVFRLADAAEERTLVFPRGLDLSRTYDVTFDNTRTTVRLSGLEMVRDGVPVRLSGALTSELILYKTAE